MLYREIESKIKDHDASLEQIEQQKASKIELEIEKARITNLATLNEGSTTGDAELIDGRIGVDGKTYDNVGVAIRNQIGKIVSFSNKNMFDISTAKLGYYGADGVIVVNANYNCSVKIPVTVGEVIYFSNDGVGCTVRKVMCYSLNDNYLNGSDFDTVSSIEIPSNVGSIIVSYSVAYTKFQMEKNSVTDYEIFAKNTLNDDVIPKYLIKEEIINDFSEVSSNLFNMSTMILNKYYSEGAYKTSTSYNCSEKISVVGGDKIYCSNDGVGFNARFVSFLKADSKYMIGFDLINVKEFTVPTNAHYMIISFVNTYEKFQVEKKQVTEYKEYNKRYIKNNSINIKSIKKQIDYEPIIYIPSEICVAVGRTIEIYNKQICINADKFHFRWFCNVGKPLRRKFQVTGTSATVGIYDLTLILYDDNMVQVYTGVIKLKIVNVLTTNKTNLQIGDSLTNTTSTNKPTYNEMRTLSNNKLSFVGTRGIVEGEKHEGRSGWKSGDYLTNSSYTFEKEGVNPFWDGSRFNWNYYKTQTGLNPNSLTIFLGTNGIANDPTPNANNIKQIVDYIRQDDATIPIFVVNTIYKSNQDGIGNMINGTDGFATNRGTMKYDEDLKTIKLALKLQELLGSYSNLHLIPLNILHDDEFNFGQKIVNVNPRSVLTEIMPADAVHPVDGYLQFADVLFSSYCCYLI